jgi:hypothetical protein
MLVPQAARGGVPDDVAEVVPTVITPEFFDFGALRLDLLAAFPKTFAGLKNNGDDSLTIYETRPTDQLHEWVADRFASAAARDGVSLDLAPPVTYERKTASLRSLRDLKERIMRERPGLLSTGTRVIDIGIQDDRNTLLVEVGHDRGRSQQALEQRYGRGHVDAVILGFKEQADRYNDTAPWNGGDQIVAEETPNPGYPEICTTGFGVKSTTARYVTTAGHCDPHYWWNYHCIDGVFCGITRTPSHLVGGPNGTVYDGVYSGYRVDTQKIRTLEGSSNLIWTKTATRRVISAPAGVAVNDSNCIEGSVQAKQSCGRVTAVDFGEGGTQYLVTITNGVLTKPGDSGAPSWRDDPHYGPIATGTHVGISGSASVAKEMSINFVLFFNGVSLNTISDP